MFAFVSVLLLYTFVRNGVTAGNSDVAFRCNPNITNMDYEPVNIATYCKDRPCIAKCCGENEVLLLISARIPPKCIKISTIDLKNSTNVTLDYSNLHIYKTDIEKKVQVTEKKLQDFKLVRNYVPVNSSCGQLWRKTYKAYILENGGFAGDMFDDHKNRWHKKDALSYCTEIMVFGNTAKGYIMAYKFYVHLPQLKDDKPKLLFTGVAMLISSCFLLLVLAVYCVLPQLRNLSGMLLMAYASALATAYMMKAVYIFIPTVHFTTCMVISPIMYFTFLSSFFWLNIMSFDIWWTFRGLRHRRRIHRQGVVIKFLWYGLYAWGVPAVMTVGAVLVDHVDKKKWPQVIRPHFETCFYEDESNERYMYAPVGILTFMNIVLFLMTVYNMWLIKKTLNNFKTNSTNTNNENTFRLYLKMSMLMGISWLLEVAQTFYDDAGIWLYILMNLYNTSIGVAIFIMFVFNKSTYTMLCKRFNIKNQQVQGANMNSSTKSKISNNRSTKSSYTKTRSTDGTDHTCNMEMSQNPDPVPK